MVRVIDNKAILRRLALPDDEGVITSIDVAIDSAMVGVGALLNTSFDLGTALDWFYIDPDLHTAVAGFYCLRLSNGFLGGDSLTVVASCPSYGASGVSCTSFRTNPEKGFIMVPEELSGSYVSVSYGYGFSDLSIFPPWLVEVVTSYTIKALSAQQISDPKEELGSSFKFLEAHAGSIVDRHLRTSSVAISPMD